jgi:hypothetical protein
MEGAIDINTQKVAYRKEKWNRRRRSKKLRREHIKK